MHERRAGFVISWVMAPPDLNLLIVLEALLTEGSVARAARRLRLSPSAVSRSLARLRAATNDPLLVRAGSRLVPTPHAEALRPQVGALVAAAISALGPAAPLDLASLTRVFTLRNRDGFVETFGADLIARVQAEAPGVQLRFVPKPDRDSTPLRDGRIDLETGVVGSILGPEVRAQALFRDRFVAVVRPGHPLAIAPTLTAYAAAQHVHLSRQGRAEGPVDAVLAALGVRRQIVAIVAGFSESLALARTTDLVATVPERYTGRLRDGLLTLPLPVAVPDIVISLLWHPRLDADPAQRWLRQCVRSVCADRTV